MIDAVGWNGVVPERRNTICGSAASDRERTTKKLCFLTALLSTARCQHWGPHTKLGTIMKERVSAIAFYILLAPRSSSYGNPPRPMYRRYK